MTTAILVPISPGELLDKITILQIKRSRMQDKSKLANVERELQLLEEIRINSVPRSARIDELSSELMHVNGRLWDIEDEIRLCEQRGDFGEDFVQLARSVYQTNDIRAAKKWEINQILNSSIVEEKEFTKYSQ